ncbi:hypothetical protein KJE20_03115 [Pyrenophora tritici-repentis]|uniref:Uncharacterized protein n=2 Tax=Pyrenophora tritici-repentis TaxID=45151 RepID=A0A922SXI2_9PLEO|nr:hypothetical protein Ptr86124_008000 [Pyrenophora tritici-repentis]KAI1689937.1 hypothetical protein KJE20_03115 [Pyrenophora tritici-repentis]
MAHTTLRPLLFAFLIQDAVAATITSMATTTPAPVVKRAVTTIGYVSVGELAGTTQCTSTRASTRVSTNNAASVSFTRITSASGSTETSIDPVDVLPPSAGIKTNNNNKKKSTPVGAIAGGVVGGIVLLGAIIFAIVFLLRRKKRNQANNNNNNNNTNTDAPQAQQQPQTQQQTPPAPVQYYQEQKPAPQQQVQQIPPPQQQHTHYDPNAPQAPQFYDPNAHTSYAATPQQGGYAVPPPEKTPAATSPVQMNPYYADNGPVSPVPQYSPAASPPPVPANVNELPTGRM